MKKLLLLLLSLAALGVQAQTTLEVGKYIRTKPCKKGAENFESMDIYARTKPYDLSKVDTLTGEGFVNEFFNDKSIDAKRLPCSMGGYTYKIMALQVVEDKGTTRRVVICATKYPLTVIWIELDKALELGEIEVE